MKGAHSRSPIGKKKTLQHLYLQIALIYENVLPVWKNDIEVRTTTQSF